MERHDAVIIGGGPAGLACAAALRRKGVVDVVVLERDAETGGVPRHCGHWGFGWESHRRLMSGPAYAARLAQGAEGADIRTRHSVLAIKAGNRISVQSPAHGVFEMEARRIVLATGAREGTRAARFLGGVRSTAVMNTGTLQQLVYLKGQTPFRHPIIIGGEWVSFSALMTCRQAEIRPAAMLVEGPRLDAPAVFAWGSRLWYGVPVWRNVRVLSIEGGEDAVTGVSVETGGRERMIACDGVVVSGGFVHEVSLLDGGADVSAVVRIGNCHGPLKTAGRAAAEARQAAQQLAEQFP